MSYLKVLSSLTRVSKNSFIAKRYVSEYAKRFGYKIVEKDPEYHVNYIKSTLYLLTSAFLLLDVAWDKQKHYEVFVKHYDETKRHFTPDFRMDLSAKPDMTFLLDDIYHPHKGEGETPISICDGRA